MNIGFFGGTFSPPHKGHLQSAEAFIKECNLAKLIIIPTKVSPFKAQSEKTASDYHRLNMTRLCFDTLKNTGIDVEVSDFEISREDTSYTYITLRHLLSQYPQNRLFMYVGSDMFLSLEKWKNAQEIFKNCCIYTRARNNDELLSLRETAEKFKKIYSADVTISHDTPFCVSSTQIRNLFIKNDTQTLKNLLTNEVFRYIMENRLYLGE